MKKRDCIFYFSYFQVLRLFTYNSLKCFFLIVNATWYLMVVKRRQRAKYIGIKKSLKIPKG